MSSESEQPDELRLPEELAAYEARLAALPLAASRLNRDELLYQAGWAAAQTKLSSVAAPRVQRESKGRQVAAWSLGSAALAASLAVAATWAIVAGHAPQAVVEAERLRPPLASVADATGGEAPQPLEAASVPRDERGELALANLEEMLRWNQATPSASLLAAIRRSQTLRWDQPIFVSTASRAAAESRAAPPTMRALRDELLPAASENSDASPESRRRSPLGDDTI
jgi:hypothetical protein